MVVENGTERLIIDPGNLTRPLQDVVGTIAVVITHEHADHWCTEQLGHIAALNPQVKIFGPPGVALAVAASGFPIAVTVAHPGEQLSVGSFTLRFFGGQHALIHSSIATVDNLGVLVNDALYYGGDSFVVPEGVTVQALATPNGAPWLTLGNVIDYLEAVSPQMAFPVHEMLLSQAGRAMSNNRIKFVTETLGGTFALLEPGEHIDI